MLQTIKSKFALFVIVFIIISVGVPISFLIRQFGENFNQRAIVLLGTTLDMMTSGLTGAMMFGENKNVQEILEKISLNKSINNIRILDSNGTILYASIKKEIGRNIYDVAPYYKGLKIKDKRNILIFKKNHIFSVSQPIKNQRVCKRCHGKSKNIAYLDIQMNLTDAEKRFYVGSMHFTYFAIVVIIFLALGFYFFFNRYINKPLKDFITALYEVEKGNLDVVLKFKKDDEFGVIAKHFNRMVSNLKESSDKIEELHLEQLERADKLVTLGELTAEIAHEVNNPAGIIMSRADYLQMQLKNDPQLQNYAEDIEVILNQTEKVSKITRNILKYSKKISKQFKKIDLIKIINESMSIIEARMKKNKVRYQKIFELDKAIINGDPLQIDQILTNLINNAIDAMPGGGKLDIIVKKNENNQIVLSIKDNGEGFDENIKEQLFSPFFTTKSKDKGTGLGLYIVSNICKNHNATIDCESLPGIGTTFTITFQGVNIK